MHNSVLYWLLCIKDVEIIMYASEYAFRDIYMIQGLQKMRKAYMLGKIL